MTKVSVAIPKKKGAGLCIKKDIVYFYLYVRVIFIEISKEVWKNRWKNYSSRYDFQDD